MSAARRGRAIVVIPTYNEADTIGALLDAIQESAPDMDVLVVDDNSPDGTARIVLDHGGAYLLRRGDKSGLGAAYRAGFAWAIGQGYEIVVQMDADLSHPPDRLPALVDALSEADVAVGSRYVAGGGIDAWTWLRRLISAWGNLFARVVLGLRTRDVTAGYKAFRRSALSDIDVINSLSDGYCFQIENAWRAERGGLRVAEVPIRFTDRTLGTSKMSKLIVVEALLRVVRWRLRELMADRGPEMTAFLAVGLCGLMVDVALFNVVRGLDPFRLWDPTVARTLAMIVAMSVTFAGNRMVTWRQHVPESGVRAMGTFALLNFIGLGISNVCLVLSHDVMGLTTALADNVSANGVGLALGTAFRYLTYRRFVFAPRADELDTATIAA
ncbi:MAG TPA: glycosyltransferase family 2 protein [Aeromicrobium sp.]|nr:glycosyltransferase family 2 protein [Aeromicrobium sp.]